MTSQLALRLPSLRKRDEGWTLIELMIVVTLIMVLASMSLLSYRNSVTRAKEATLRSQLYIVRDAIDQYYADKAKYPDSLQTLVSEQYLRGMPMDPFTESKDSWQTIPAEPAPGSTSASAGIFDIKSGSELSSPFTGDRYSDW